MALFTDNIEAIVMASPEHLYLNRERKIPPEGWKNGTKSSSKEDFFGVVYFNLII